MLKMKWVGCLMAVMLLLVSLSVEVRGDTAIDILLNSIESAEISKVPLQIDIFAQDLSTILVLLKSQCNQETKGMVRVVSSSGLKFTEPMISYFLPANQTKIVKFNLTQSSFSLLNQANITVTATGVAGIITITAKLDLFSCPIVTEPISIDGDLKEWKDIKYIVLGGDNLNPPDIKGHLWEGPDDLSSLVYTAWDENNFYFAAKVRDDKFVQNCTDKDIWKGDSIQISFDTLNDAMKGSFGYDNTNDYEYGFALTSKGAQVYRWICPGDKTRGVVGNIKLAVKKFNGYMNYEVAIPVEEIAPLKLEEGRIFGFNFIINEDDGIGRRWCIQLTPGISKRKTPSAFKDWVLIK